MTDYEIPGVDPATGEEILEFLYRIGENIAAYRNALGLTQPEIAFLGKDSTEGALSRHAISNLERGEIARCLSASAVAMGLEITDFMSPPSEEYLASTKAIRESLKSQIGRKKEEPVAPPKEEEKRPILLKKKTPYNTFYVFPVTEEQVTDAATAVWDYTDERRKSKENPKGWTDNQVEEAMLMLFGDLKP